MLKYQTVRYTWTIFCRAPLEFRSRGCQQTRLDPIL